MSYEQIESEPGDLAPNKDGFLLKVCSSYYGVSFLQLEEDVMCFLTGILLEPTDGVLVLSFFENLFPESQGKALHHTGPYYCTTILS